MTIRQLVLLALVIVGSPLVSGCSVRTADMTLMSTRMVNIDRVDLDKLPTTQRVVGEDRKWVVLFIPIGLPHLKDAVDDALNKGKGDLMTDAVVHQSYWTALLFGQTALTVEGDVVKTRKQ
jgi:hypothetical protein